MNFKRFAAWLLCLALLFTILPASATQFTGSGGSIILPGQLTVEQAWSSSSALPMHQVTSVTDGDPATSWDAAAGGINAASTAYLMLTLDAPATVSSLWIRNGDQRDAYAYYTNGCPSQVTVHLWRRLADGSNAQAAQYTYEMHEEYQPGVYSTDWYGGYQLLPLPAPMNDIISIVINVDRWETPIGSNTVRISDVAICGASNIFVPPVTDIPPVTQAPPPVQAPSYTGRTIYAVLNQKIATRTGPSTKYTEPGTFLKAGDTVQVISLVYDNNDVPWVLVDFTAYGGHRRAYTGLKRLDISADQIPEERPLNLYVTIRQDVTPRQGPGRDYMKHKDVTLYAGESATVIMRENGWVMLEIARPDQPLMRVWLQEEHVRW